DVKVQVVNSENGQHIFTKSQTIVPNQSGTCTSQEPLVVIDTTLVLEKGSYKVYRSLNPHMDDAGVPVMETLFDTLYNSASSKLRLEYDSLYASRKVWYLVRPIFTKRHTGPYVQEEN